MRKIVFLLLAIILFSACEKSDTYLQDPNNFLSGDEKKMLRTRLEEVNNTDKYALFIHIIHSDIDEKKGQHMEQVFAKIAPNIRRDAVLVYIASADRYMHIRTGETIANYLTDSLCLYTIGKMTPYFSQGQYYEGLFLGINTIDSIITNERRVVF